VTELNCAVFESIPDCFLHCPQGALLNCFLGRASLIFPDVSGALYSFPCCCMAMGTLALRPHRKYCGVI
jgi:hypothetical protein